MTNSSQHSEQEKEGTVYEQIDWVELVREVTKNRKLNFRKYAGYLGIYLRSRFQMLIVTHCFPAHLSFLNATLSWKWAISFHTDHLFFFFFFVVCGVHPRKCKMFWGSKKRHENEQIQLSVHALLTLFIKTCCLLTECVNSYLQCLKYICWCHKFGSWHVESDNICKHDRRQIKAMIIETTPVKYDYWRY